jgi:hypothetical protein
MVTTRSAFGIIPCRPRRDLAIDWALDVAPHLSQARSGVGIAIATDGEYVGIFENVLIRSCLFTPCRAALWDLFLTI